MKSLLNSQKGWVFIDALIGMVILSVALTVILMAFTQNTKTTSATKNYNEAVIIAQQTLEELKLQDGVTTTSNVFITAPPDILRNGVSFSIITSSQTVSETLDNKLIPIRATVTWTEPTTNHAMQVQIVNYYYLR